MSVSNSLYPRDTNKDIAHVFQSLELIFTALQWNVVLQTLHLDPVVSGRRSGFAVK